MSNSDKCRYGDFRCPYIEETSGGCVKEKCPEWQNEPDDIEFKVFTKAVEPKIIQVKCGITRDSMFYKDFKEYWDDNKSVWKKRKCRNIIHRIIHYRDFISRDGNFIWKDFLFYSSPIFPVKMKAWFSYKRSVKQWNKIVNTNVDELTKQIDKEILNEAMKNLDVDKYFSD